MGYDFEGWARIRAECEGRDAPDGSAINYVTDYFDSLIRDMEAGAAEIRQMVKSLQFREGVNEAFPGSNANVIA